MAFFIILNYRTITKVGDGIRELREVFGGSCGVFKDSISYLIAILCVNAIRISSLRDESWFAGFSQWLGVCDFSADFI